MIWFVELAVYGLASPERWRLSTALRVLLLLLVAAAAAVLSLPGEILGIFLSPEATTRWLRAVDVAMNSTLILLLIMALVLRSRLRLVEEPKVALSLN